MKTSKTIAEMSNGDLLQAMRADTPLARVRAVFAENYAEIEQREMQRERLTPIERRRMEMQAANRILELFGVALP